LPIIGKGHRRGNRATEQKQCRSPYPGAAELEFVSVDATGHQLVSGGRVEADIQVADIGRRYAADSEVNW